MSACRKEGVMALKNQNAAYTEKVKSEEIAQERQFWLDAKYSDEHKASER